MCYLRFIIISKNNINIKLVYNKIIIYVIKNLNLKLYQQRKEEKIVISIRSFRESFESIRYVSCNIVLVIDISESIDFKVSVLDKK